MVRRIMWIVFLCLITVSCATPPTTPIKVTVEKDNPPPSTKWVEIPMKLVGDNKVEIGNVKATSLPPNGTLQLSIQNELITIYNTPYTPTWIAAHRGNEINRFELKEGETIKVTFEGKSSFFRRKNAIDWQGAEAP